MTMAPRTISFTAGVALAAIIGLCSLAAAQVKSSGPHVHGHGTLSIAAEGQAVEMELEVPGADIVGFEHAPGTPAEKAAVAKAKATLADPARLFRLSRSAGCKLVKANVELEHGGRSGAAHTEFHARYAFTCAKPKQLKAISFPYFGEFAGAKQLVVNIVTAKGQSRIEVTRKKPQLDVGGLM
jgi:hypothetical protein